MTRRPVLLGGSGPLHTCPWSTTVAATWVPVLLCLCVIAIESTDTFSSAHTSGWLRHVVEATFGPMTQARWDVVHHHIRKAGHFTGYGMVGLAWLRAWLLTWRPLLQRRGATLWRAFSVVMALLCTLVVACTDELHQTFLPSRTGMVSDALLDTTGAAAAALLVACAWRRTTLPGARVAR